MLARRILFSLRAILYLEKAHLLQPANKATMQSLLKLYARTNQTEKYTAMKEKNWVIKN